MASFDSEGFSLRSKEFPEYKSVSNMPEELKEQIPLIKKLLNLLSINIFEIVFMISLLCEYQNLKALDLDIDNINIQSIYDDFYTNKEYLKNNLKSSFIKLKEKLHIKDNYYLNNCFYKKGEDGKT